MDIGKIIVRFVLLPIVAGVAMALGGRIVINAIDNEPLLQKPKHDVALRIEMGDTANGTVK